MARPRSPLLTRERIRTAALAIVDADGLDALSMRRLALDLGVSAPSLYFHVPTKEALLDDLADTVMSAVDTSAFADGWEAGLRGWAGSYRAALAAHPHIVPFLAHGPGQRDIALQHADAVHGGLIAAGWPPREATMIGASVKYLVLGSALASFSRGFPDDVQVYVDRYAHLRDAYRLRDHADELDAAAFDFALDTLLAGLRSRAPAS